MISVVFVCAWGTKPIELLDDKKLIDLDKAIEFAKPGADSLFPIESTAVTTSVHTTTTKPVPKEKKIYINVSSENITYDGKECKFNELEEKLRKNNDKNTTFILNDDFAEAHVYKKVLNLLKDLNNEIVLNYKENRS